ncbi:MAG: class I SAM-dependent methyltransferase [Gemmatimonadetes bacterium]|jgi:SAM-dependent methyltransferase|nr:class I SAM-dependent methyltransferase [Gemmatimonadota bacterium]
MLYRDVTFGDPEFDEWYIKHGSNNFDSLEFVRKHFDAAREALSLCEEDCILDAGCGTGSYTLEFARCGYAVTGMDVSSTFLREAERCRDAEGLDIEFIRGDYNSIDFDQRFSVIVFEGSLFYRSESEFLALLRKLLGTLVPGGRLKFNRPNPPRLRRWVSTMEWTEQEEGVFVLQKNEYSLEEASTRYHWIKLDINRGTHYRSILVNKWLDPERVTFCLNEAGFTDIRLLKWRGLDPFDPMTENRFTVVAHRPG